MQAEQQLKASLKELNDLKAALDEHAIVAITDPQGKITYVNDKFCAISKYSREELLGQDHRIINSGHHPKEFMRDFGRRLRQGRVWNGEIKNKAKDGSFYWVDATIVPFLNEQGKPRQYVAIRDRHHRTQSGGGKNPPTQCRAGTAGRRAHGRIGGLFLFRLARPARAGAGHRRFRPHGRRRILPRNCRRRRGQKLERISQNALKMGQLIDGLLTFSRFSRQPLNKRMVSPVAMVNQALEDLQAEQANRRVKIAVADLPVCQADPTLLQQVFTNLLSNALKYSRQRDPAVIEIGASNEKGQWVYFIKDNGAGFERQYAHKLFGVFQRFHRADQFEGTGVGLAIVQRIILRHGGRVWGEAEPEKGATFYFTLESGN